MVSSVQYSARLTAGMKLYGNAEMVDKIYALNKTLIGDNPAKLKLWTVLKLPSEPSVKEPVAKQ